MSVRDRSFDAWVGVWLETRIVIRDCGRSVDIDRVPSTLTLDLPLTVVTAANPDGRPRSAIENRQANRRLRQHLDDRQLAWRPARGSARDASWAEPGFAVSGLSETEARSIGAEFGQLAVFVVAETEVVVVGCRKVFRRARPRPSL